MAGCRNTILAVDDEVANLRSLKRLLHKEHDLICAQSGEEAILILDSDQAIDLVILDIKMPGMNGYEVLKHIRRSQFHRDTPVLMVTANISAEDEVLGLQLGATDYIHKPWNSTILGLRIRNNLQQVALRKQLKGLADTDYLTGLKNPRSFAENFDRVWRQAARTGSNIFLALIDIDHFKQFNDNYGHAEGDEALKEVARVIQAHFRRATDFVARYGGEEFVVLCSDIQQDKLMARLNKMVAAVEKLQWPHEYSSASPWITISVGAASINADKDTTKERLFMMADQHLYRAKSNGRNRLEFLTESAHISDG